MSELISRLNSNISYEYFYNEFLVKNKVCIFDKSITNSWKCIKEWITSDGKPDLDTLNKLFGKSLVSVSDCNTKYFNSNSKQEMSFNQFINYWKSVINSDYNYLENDLKILYLKDWHFVQQFPEYIAYKTPTYFESDWINEYFIKNIHLRDDYRFVYMGPKQSWTPLHTDVFGSFSWSANICGAKKWLIIPPGNEERLKAINNNEMPHNFYEIPDYKNKLQELKGFELIQKSGELIFIPSGYIHSVINIEDTISLNHNWFNATNIHIIFKNIFKAMSEVETQLSDLKSVMDLNEWQNECQILLKLHFGLNLNDLIDCLVVISKRIKSELMDGLESNELSFRVISDKNALIKLLDYFKTNNLLNFDNKLEIIENNIS